MVVVVRHKLRQYYISRKVPPGTNKLYRNLHTGRFYNYTGHDVTDYFRLAVIEVQRTVENAACDGFAVVYLDNRLS